MRLRGMADVLTVQQQQPELQSLTFEERLGLLVDQEWVDRQNRRLARLLKEAKFRVAACMEDIDYQHREGWTGRSCAAWPPASGSSTASMS